MAFKKIKLKILKMIQHTCHKIGDWAWLKRILLLNEKKR
jgi:hypothetical protein